jgi:Uma2 family endonuclease
MPLTMMLRWPVETRLDVHCAESGYPTTASGAIMIHNEATMNIRPDLRMSKAAFLEWDAGEGQRCELVGGLVTFESCGERVVMPHPSQAHGVIVVNLTMLLCARLDPKQWRVIMEFGLDTGPDTLRYPDIVVFPTGSPDKSYSTSTPALLAEVLSPSSEVIDLGDKAAEYLELPSLLAYIVLSQDARKAWMWSRVSTAAPFAPGPKVISEAEAFIPVAGLQLELPMADIYAGTEIG